jgi:DNA-directed RNA polymerase specialized sigma24 family protein
MNLHNVDIHAEVSLPQVQAIFLAILPKIEHVARFHFQDCPCSDRKQDCVGETVALCWIWYRRLVAKGRDPSAFVTTFARLAALAVSSGRRACPQESARDVLSKKCQRRRQYVVTPFSNERSFHRTLLEDALRDNTQSPVPDQVQFRVDFSSWCATLDERRRKLVESMMQGDSTSELASRFGVTAGRIAQLRREFHDSYAVFCGDSWTSE